MHVTPSTSDQRQSTITKARIEGTDNLTWILWRECHHTRSIRSSTVVPRKFPIGGIVMTLIHYCSHDFLLSKRPLGCEPPQGPCETSIPEQTSGVETHALRQPGVRMTIG